MGTVKKLGFSTAEAIEAIGSQKLFRRALAAGWIKPHVTTGAGGVSLYSWQAIEALWGKLAKEKPPLLPCEVRARVKAGKPLPEVAGKKGKAAAPEELTELFQLDSN